MSLGILAVGLFTGTVLSSPPGLEMPKLEPWAAVGGAIWMCGNLMCPYIIKLIGMGLGLTVWDLSNMIMGWFTGRFGLFGVDKEHIDRPWVNGAGLGMATLSLIFFSLAASCDAKDGEATRKATCSAKSAADETGQEWPNSEFHTSSTAFPEFATSETDLENQVTTPPKEIIDNSLQTGKTPTSGQDKCPLESPDARNFAIGLCMALVAGAAFVKLCSGGRIKKDTALLCVMWKECSSEPPSIFPQLLWKGASERIIVKMCSPQFLLGPVLRMTSSSSSCYRDRQELLLVLSLLFYCLCAVTTGVLRFLTHYPWNAVVNLPCPVSMCCAIVMPALVMVAVLMLSLSS